MHAFCRFEKFDACCWYSRAKVMGTSVCLTGTVAMCFWQSSSESPGSTINPSAVLAKPLTLDKAIYNDWIVGSLCLLAAAIIQSCTTVLQNLSLRSLAGMVLMFAGLYSVLWAKKNERFSLVGVDGDEKLRVEDDEEPLLLS
ncbi:hypothetical protein B296_00043680 [Ensete ventricosum]|uniref:WAT1-related protein n=1 Tax=Ensete ventricosum TaxID=4639 RepID=A0A426Y8I1_ENSVE|nr:hypothetical protein B296_00043680 [Ensete ventricosum]